MIKPLLDLHTHTIVSGHAFSTLGEMVAEAQRKGLKLYGISEHGPAIPGTCDPIYFRNLHAVPRIFGDMRLMLGAELNILDTKGTLDLEDFYCEKMDYRVAGVHSLCWKGGTVKENTDGVLAAMYNHWVNIISHPGDGTADLDFDRLVKESPASGCLLEVNNYSLKPARGKVKAWGNNRQILLSAMKHGVPVILGSDAHITFDIANYSYARALIEEVGFPDELILNDKTEEFFRFTGLQL